jgi:FkbM family methyltransferase
MLQKILRALPNLSRLPEIVACYRETRQWRAVTSAYLGLRSLDYPYKLHLRTGEVLTFEERNDVVIFWLVFVRQHYPVRPSDRLIVDVGANIGLFTIYAQRHAARSRVIAIEPFPDTCERLRKHVAENRISDRVTVLNCALMRESGHGKMDSVGSIPSQYRRIDAAETRALNLEHRGTGALEDAPGIDVEQRTLADVLTLVDSNVDLLKMNIHGSEYAVLMSTPGQVLKRLRRIAVQYHELPASENMGKPQLFSYLKQNGFRVTRDRDTLLGSGLAVLEQSSAI